MLCRLPFSSVLGGKGCRSRLALALITCILYPYNDSGLATSAAEREQLGDPKLMRLFRQRFLHETRLELSIALARGKALQIDAARDKLAGITVQRARASPQ